MVRLPRAVVAPRHFPVAYPPLDISPPSFLAEGRQRAGDEPSKSSQTRSRGLPPTECCAPHPTPRVSPPTRRGPKTGGGTHTRLGRRTGQLGLVEQDGARRVGGEDVGPRRRALVVQVRGLAVAPRGRGRRRGRVRVELRVEHGERWVGPCGAPAGETAVRKGGRKLGARVRRRGIARRFGANRGSGRPWVWLSLFLLFFLFFFLPCFVLESVRRCCPLEGKSLQQSRPQHPLDLGPCVLLGSARMLLKPSTACHT